MKTAKAWIESCQDLSSSFGNNFVEFVTGSGEAFNQKLAAISQGMVQSMIAEVDEETKHLASQMPHADFLEKYFQVLRPKTDRLNYLTLKDDEVTHLKTLISQCLHQYLQLYRTEYRSNKPNQIHAWTLVYKRWYGSAPHYHHHNSMNISGIYFVKGDFALGNGDLEVLPNKDKPNFKTNYLPKPGRLILFPSDLLHSTGPYESEIERISIAFDIWFKPIERRYFINLS